jgi:serine phosphatase RsbU (regulator of sigma subunit)
MLEHGRAEFLTVSPGAPLGVHGGRRPEPVTVPFPPGSTLVAFTDGLIEKRGHDLDARHTLLEEVAAKGPAQPDDLIISLPAC